MYQYIWDTETGGLLLTTELTKQGYSNEPRPVYYQELDILGFDKYNSRSSELMDDMTKKVVASTLFPSLADWEIVKRVDENSWIISNSRSMSSVWLNFTPSRIYVSEWVKTRQVRWMIEGCMSSSGRKIINIQIISNLAPKALVIWAVWEFLISISVIL